MNITLVENKISLTDAVCSKMDTGTSLNGLLSKKD